MRSRLLALGMGVVILVVACRGVDVGTPVPDSTSVPAGPSDPIATNPDNSPTADPGTTLPSGVKGWVIVDSTEILYLESFPVQVRLLARGSLPTACHQAQWAVEDKGWAIDVALWSVLLLGQDCSGELEPFEVSIPLGSFEQAATPVLLNGEQIGRLAIGAEPVSDPVRLVGAGWSFGMCGGYCQAELVLAGASVTLTGSGWFDSEPLFENRGTLTPEGRDRIAVAAAPIGSDTLEPVYGCPDCADGGAAYLVFEREGATSRHEMDFGRPPEIMAEVHRLALDIIDALEKCESTEVVVPADDCQTWQGL